MAHQIPKSEVQLWKWLERDTGHAVTRVEREWLEEDRMVEVSLDSSEPDGYSECVEALRKTRKYYKALLSESGQVQASPSRSKVAEVKLTGVATKPEMLRAKVLARWVAAQILRSRVIRDIRSKLLRDPERDLSPLGVMRLIQSPAAGYLSPEFYRERAIPISGHTSELIGRIPRITDDLELDEEVELLIRWKRRELRHRVNTIGPSSGPPLSKRTFSFPSFGWKQHEATICSGSCLWLLAEACEEVAAAHRWTHTEAIWLILSGTTPDRRPVRSRWRTTWSPDGEPLAASITLNVELFVSGKTVARAYERARSDFLLARPRRPMGEKALRLFEFVEEHRTPDQVKVPWSKLMREWDRRVREGWRYKDRGHFMRDYQRARRLLIEEGVPKLLRILQREPQSRPPDEHIY